MSMLIIGVNPPKSCYACSWYNKVECPVNDGRYYYRAQRHPSCPLIELPPHGRLGDLDALQEQIKLSVQDAHMSVLWKQGMAYAHGLVEASKTVIEAEGSEE